MLHAAAMLSGIFVIWLLYTQLLSTPSDFGVAALAALVCVLAAVRLGGLKRNVFARAPRVFALWLSRWSANVRGVFATLRAAAAADVSLKPALVRLKLQTQNADAREPLHKPGAAARHCCCGYRRGRPASHT
ncbi:MAG: hypothetical protein R3C16_12700 [Hyphomonadaceae bacterium]